MPGGEGDFSTALDRSRRLLDLAWNVGKWSLIGGGFVRSVEMGETNRKVRNYERVSVPHSLTEPGQN